MKIDLLYPGFAENMVKKVMGFPAIYGISMVLLCINIRMIASIGTSDGLRGYRNQRFTGKNAFYQNTDLRFNFRKIKTRLLPLQFGVYGGFDYGRVWMENETQ